MSAVYSDIAVLDGVAFRDSGIMREVEAAIERARVVGVLDAWADALGYRVWAMIRNSSGGWAVELHEGADGQEASTVLGHANTPDDARAAAAKAIEAEEV
ncbi:MAG TPA: hypothetical protein VI653_13350 [Steroidobacteraceae bacterium]